MPSGRGHPSITIEREWYYAKRRNNLLHVYITRGENSHDFSFLSHCGPTWLRQGTKKFKNKPNKRLKVTSPLVTRRATLVTRVRKILPPCIGTLLAAPAPRPRGARTAILPGRFLNLHFYLMATGTCPTMCAYINLPFFYPRLRAICIIDWSDILLKRNK